MQESRIQNYMVNGLLVFPSLLIFFSFVFPAIMRRQSLWFGFNQLSVVVFTGFTQILYLSILFALSCFLLFKDNLLRFGGMILILITLFSFRSNTMNQDGKDLLFKIPTDVNRVGAHVVHDEMLELYVHSVFWSMLNEFTGHEVAVSYQILSIVSGLIFMLFLVGYAKENIYSSRLLFVLLVSSGGFVQLFFGDVENYSITVTIVLLYLFIASRVLKGKSSIITASVVLGLAMCFHLVAGFLIPSLIYLVTKIIQRKELSGRYIVPIVFIPFAMLFICMILFDWLGILPLENFWLYSHALAHGGDIASILPPLTIAYYLEMINLIVLLFPSFLLIPLVIFLKKLKEVDIFLLIAAGFLLLLPLFWKAALGVLNDWNLFAILAVPSSIFVWSFFVQQARNRRYKIVLIIMLLFSMLNTFSWIVKNHVG